jgi:hypothetical protein
MVENHSRSNPLHDLPRKAGQFTRSCVGLLPDSFNGYHIILEYPWVLMGGEVASLGGDACRYELPHRRARRP